MVMIKLLGPVATVLAKTKRKRDDLRLQKLIARGLRIGKNVCLVQEVYFDHSHPYLIEIEDNCRISNGVRFLAHDATAFRQLGVTRLAPVRIREGTFIGERAIILPGVTIGPNALIAAGSVVTRDIGEDMCAAGNPARPYGKFSRLLERYANKITDENVINIGDLESGALSIEEVRALVGKHGTLYLRGVPENDPNYVNTDMDLLRLEAIKAAEALLEAKVRAVQAAQRGETQTDDIDVGTGFPKSFSVST